MRKLAQVLLTLFAILVVFILLLRFLGDAPASNVINASDVVLRNVELSLTEYESLAKWKVVGTAERLAPGEEMPVRYLIRTDDGPKCLQLEFDTPESHITRSRIRCGDSDDFSGGLRMRIDQDFAALEGRAGKD